MTKEQLYEAIAAASFAWQKAAVMVCAAVRNDESWSRVRELLKEEGDAKRLVQELVDQVEGGTP